ncbi:MAG: ACT domain-containing protein, partial [Chloroflexi bacterium]|nr:ACT domain-containing protein [Chloroflexota bacterium]
FTVTRTTDELSITCPEADVPRDVAKCERGWRAFKLHGPFDFGLTGILASVLNPLAEAGVGIFALSTFDTDYVLVKEENVEKAIEALRKFGHIVKT